MKYLKILTVSVVLFLVACSIDNNDMDYLEATIYSANLHSNSQCIGAIYNLKDDKTILGRVEVSNEINGEYIYIRFIAKEGYTITSIKSGFAVNISDIPINNGGIIPGKLVKKDYEKLNEVIEVIDSDQNIVYTAKVELVSDSGVIYSAWAGDIIIGSKNSAYFEYAHCSSYEDIPCFVGHNKSQTIFNSYVQENLMGVDLLRNHYLGLLDEGVSRNGTFDKSIWSIIISYRENNFQTFTTTYKVAEDCSESVILSIRVIEDTDTE